jgi:hypothetical protein
MNFGTENCVRVDCFDIPYRYYRCQQPLRSFPIFCPLCGLFVERGWLSRHNASVAHRSAQRIRALLRNDCITNAEIARRLGVTRERIRQIAKQFGYQAGRVRHRACAIQRWFSLPLPPKAELVRKLAVAHGLTCEPIKSVHGRGWRRFRLMIEGHSCGIYSIWAHKKKPSCLRLCRPESSSMPDFALYPWQQGVFVIPRSRFQTIKCATMFVFGRERRKSGTHSAQHDWTSFWNAWHLLRPRSSVLAEKKGDAGPRPDAALGLRRSRQTECSMIFPATQRKRFLLHSEL